MALAYRQPVGCSCDFRACQFLESATLGLEHIVAGALRDAFACSGLLRLYRFTLLQPAPTRFETRDFGLWCSRFRCTWSSKLCALHPNLWCPISLSYEHRLTMCNRTTSPLQQPTLPVHQLRRVFVPVPRQIAHHGTAGDDRRINAQRVRCSIATFLKLVKTTTLRFRRTLRAVAENFRERIFGAKKRRLDRFGNPITPAW